jgi:hypothetical protein
MDPWDSPPDRDTRADLRARLAAARQPVRSDRAVASSAASGAGLGVGVRGAPLDASAGEFPSDTSSVSSFDFVSHVNPGGLQPRGLV